VILLADRGFDDDDLFCLARDLGWSFRIRLKSSTGKVEIRDIANLAAPISRLW